MLDDGEVAQLRVAALPFVNQDLCESWFGFHYGHSNGCIGSGRASVCGKVRVPPAPKLASHRRRAFPTHSKCTLVVQADVGSPVVNWRGELVGVAINNVNYCSVPGRPTVFTNFADAELNDWILANVHEKQPLPTTTTGATPPDGCFGDGCDYDCDPDYEDCTTGSGDYQDTERSVLGARDRAQGR